MQRPTIREGAQRDGVGKSTYGDGVLVGGIAPCRERANVGSYAVVVGIRFVVVKTVESFSVVAGNRAAALRGVKLLS